MADKFIKVVLLGILICLIIIAFKSINVNVTSQAPNVNVDNSQQFLQIAPNRIGIVDTGIHSGYQGQLIIFDFDPNTKTFNYVETLNAPYILNNPEEYGIPFMQGKTD